MSSLNAIIGISQTCNIKSFGENNPDKVFFVIRQDTLGRGLFSILSAVICYIHFAEEHNFIPVVDFQNFQTEYNELHEINGVRNAFEYYFLPLNDYTLDDVYKSRNVIFSSSGYPCGYDYTIAHNANLFPVYRKHIRVKSAFEEAAQTKILSLSGRTLGVQFRGQEMRTSPGHWFPPTLRQMCDAIDAMCNEFHYEYIFVSTEDKELLNSLIARYGRRVFFNDNFRTSGINAYKIYPRKNHKFLLGKEILLDMLCLSYCDSLISCSSNVAWMARFINNGKYKSTIFINNGPNSSNRFFAKVMWQLKACLPEALGGFKSAKDAFVWQRSSSYLK